jgi:hypothetical protein
MIIFRVAQGIAWTSQTTVSDHTIHGMPGHLKHLSIIRFQAVSGDHPVTGIISQPRNQFPVDELHVVLGTETNSHGTTERVGPNAN